MGRQQYLHNKSETVVYSVSLLWLELLREWENTRMNFCLCGNERIFASYFGFYPLGTSLYRDNFACTGRNATLLPDCSIWPYSLKYLWTLWHLSNSTSVWLLVCIIFFRYWEQSLGELISNKFNFRFYIWLEKIKCGSWAVSEKPLRHLFFSLLSG